MTDRTRLPLPAEQELEIKHRFGDVVTVKGYGPAEMHADADAENAALRERVKVLEDELGEVLEWAVKERAPLRNQEIASIRRALEKTT